MATPQDIKDVFALVGKTVTNSDLTKVGLWILSVDSTLKSDATDDEKAEAYLRYMHRTTREQVKNHQRRIADVDDAWKD